MTITTATAASTATILDELGAVVQNEHGYWLDLLAEETNAVLVRYIPAGQRPTHPEYKACLERLGRFEPVLDRVRVTLAGTGARLEWHPGRPHLLTIRSPDGTVVDTWPTTDPDTAELLAPERSATLAGAALLTMLAGL